MKTALRALVAAIGFLGVFSLPVQSFAQAFNPPPNTFAYGPGWQPVGPTEYQSGSYQMSNVSGTMAAALAAGSPIFSFRYTGSGVAVIKKVTISAGDLVGFAAGFVNFQLFAARSFSASDSGGTAATLTGNNGKLRTSFATTAVGDMRISSTATLTAGTRTLDTMPLGGISISTVTTAGGTVLGAFDILTAGASNYPAVFANNEGFVIQATVPATGTWSTTVTVEWDEFAAF